MTALKIPFSSLGRIVQCPGSVALCEQTRALTGRPPRTEAQAEGIAAAWVAAEYVRGKNIIPGTLATPNDVPVTEEMIRGAVMWRDALPPSGCVVETPLACTRIHPTECGGIPDARHWDPVTRTITVADYKYGHKFVDHYENWQLIGEALGVLEEIGANGLDEMHITVHMVIVQPRCYHPEGHVREWRVNAAELRAYCNVASGSAYEATIGGPGTRFKVGPGTRFKVGPKCAECDAAGYCTALQDAGGEIADYAARPEAVELTPESIGGELTYLDRAVELLEARYKALMAQGEAHATAGRRVPGWGLKPGRSNLAWKMPPAEVLAYGRALGADLSKPADCVTPSQAISGKLLPPELVEAVADRPPAANKFVKIDAKRALSK